MDDSSLSIDRAREEPESVSVSEAALALDAEDGAERKTAADVLYAVSKAEPARLAEGNTIPRLVVALEDDDALVRESAALALAEVATATDAVTPVATALVGHLDDDYAIVVDALASALRDVAASTPAALVEEVADICAHLDADLDTTRFHLLSALVAVAGEYPGRIEPAIDPLLAVVRERDPVRGSVASSDPIDPGQSGDPGQPGDAVESVDSEHSREADRPDSGTDPGGADQEEVNLEASITEAALAVLATMAAERLADAADLLGPHVSTFRALLEDPHAGIRSVSAGTLAAIAEYDPETVEPATDALADRLNDYATVVAGNAVWALRYIDTPGSRAALREADPDHDEVRAVIETALDDLDAAA